MDGHEGMDMGIPWLTHPLRLHSSREDECELTPDQCTYKRGYWRNWYRADFVYGLGTIYFCIAVIAVFILPYALSILARPNAKQTTLWRRVNAVARYAAYRGYHIRGLGWYSPPLGLLLVGILGTIFFFCMTLGPKPYYWPNGTVIAFGDSPPLATRAGWMSLALLPFVLASSSKFNLITLLTGVSHEKIQPLHRWGGWAMFVLALIHTFPFIVFNVWTGTVEMQWEMTFQYWSGVAALVPQAYLTFFSIKVLRDKFYEFFKATHIAVAIVFAIFFFLHCDGILTSWDYFIAAGIVYFAPFFALQLRTFCEHGLRHRARIELQEHGQLVIRIRTASHFTWTPGQHMFLRFLSPKLGLHSLTSHPFTICSLPSAGEAVFHVRPHGGITARLAALAASQTDTSLLVWLDGPYGGMGQDNLANYDHALLIAGGSGAGFTLPVIEDFIRSKWRPSLSNETLGMENEKNQLPGLTIVCAVRSKTIRLWFLRELEHLTEQYSAGGSLPRIDVRCHLTQHLAGSAEAEFDTSSESDLERINVTAEKAEAPTTSSHTAAMVLTRLAEGRPDLRREIFDVVNTSESVGIAVCGPASMMHDVRNAVAEAQSDIIRGGHSGASKDVFLHTEHFEW